VADAVQDAPRDGVQQVGDHSRLVDWFRGVGRRGGRHKERVAVEVLVEDLVVAQDAQLQKGFTSRFHSQIGMSRICSTENMTLFRLELRQIETWSKQKSF
jgi:hypothetical protein